MASEPAPGGQTHVVEDHGLEEVDHFLVGLVFWSVAWDVEGAEACCVLAELVAPEVAWDNQYRFISKIHSL